MKTNLNIKVDIGGRPYSLTITREEEELIRKASENVNHTIKEYSKAFEYKDMQDLYAMIALQHASGHMRLENEKSFKDKEMKDKLLEIDALLSSHLKL
jgi:cell division protein ZapA